AGREPLPDGGEDPRRIVLVGQVVHHAAQQRRERGGEVEQADRGDLVEQLAGAPQVGRDDGGLVVDGQQRAGVGEHDGVVVDVDDPHAGVDGPGDLVDVVLARQAGADVEDLPDPGLAHQVGHAAAQEGAVVPGDLPDLGDHGAHGVGGPPVDLEVVLAAEQVVVDARD